MRKRCFLLAAGITTALVGAPYKPAILKNPLRENIAIAQEAGDMAPTVQVRELSQKEVLDTMNGLLFGTATETQKNDLVAYLTAVKKSDLTKFKGLVAAMKADPMLAPALEKYKTAMSGKATVEGMCEALYSIHQAINGTTLNEATRKACGGDAFVAQVVVWSYFGQGKFSVFADVIARNNFIAPFGVVFNAFIAQRQDLSAALSGYDTPYSTLANGLTDAQMADTSTVGSTRKRWTELAYEAVVNYLEGLNLPRSNSTEVVTSMGQLLNVRPAAARSETVVEGKPGAVRDARPVRRPQTIGEWESELEKDDELNRFYNASVSAWLTSKISDSGATHDLVDLVGLVRHIKEAAATEAKVNKGWKINNDWLDQNLLMGTFDAFLRKKASEGTEEGKPLI